MVKYFKYIVLSFFINGVSSAHAYNEKQIILGGQNSAAATLNWNYSVVLKKDEKYLLRRTFKWETFDSQTHVKLHEAHQVHYYKIENQDSYKREGAFYNLWRSDAYSAAGPVVDAQVVGTVLQLPKLRRGAQPTAEQQKQIDEYHKAFSSRFTKGWMIAEDVIFKIEKNIEGVFYKFPSLIRSGPWLSKDYPLGPVHNLRRDYPDFQKFEHAIELKSELPSQPLASNSVNVEWETSDKPRLEDFNIQ